jgi:hypothetical protein
MHASHSSVVMFESLVVFEVERARFVRKVPLPLVPAILAAGIPLIRELLPRCIIFFLTSNERRSHVTSVARDLAVL